MISNIRKKAQKKKWGESDEELLQLVIDGNQDAYREIFGRYQKKLFAYVYHLVGNKEEAEDILQNVFVKAYRNLNKFDMQKKFSSWVYRIAHNESVNYLKRKSKRKLVSWEDVVASKDKLETSSDLISPEDFWIRKELRREVNLALDRIPKKYKEVLILRYFLDKSYDEMKEILDKPRNTVGTLLARAKKSLVREINKLNEF